MKACNLFFLIVAAVTLSAVSVFTCVKKQSIDQSIIVYPKLEFINQQGEIVDPKNIKSKYCIVAFFFTSCPTICPLMLAQMKRVEAVITVSDKYKILFYTIDPDHDSQQQLMKYSRRHRLNNGKWWLLNGSKDDMKEIGNCYALRGGIDKNDSSSFMHDGAFVLVENYNQAVLGRYQGTDSSSVDQLINDIREDL